MGVLGVGGLISWQCHVAVGFLWFVCQMRVIVTRGSHAVDSLKLWWLFLVTQQMILRKEGGLVGWGEDWHGCTASSTSQNVINIS